VIEHTPALPVEPEPPSRREIPAVGPLPTPIDAPFPSSRHRR
jgi:hypothetical protein